MRTSPLENPSFLDARATVVLCILAGGLSAKRLMGNDLDFLAMDYTVWPEEPWRLLTACLLHGGFLHLAFNLIWTWRLGFVLEPILGLPAMVGAIVLLGVGSSAAEWALFSGGIGLSGIVYGLFGMLWALERHDPRFRGVIDRHVTELFVGWFFLCVIGTFMGWMRIANVAHGAGFALGVALALALLPARGLRTRGRLALGALTVLIALGATVARPWINMGRARAWELAHDAYEAFEEGDVERAVRDLERSVERDEDFAPSWRALAALYDELGRPEDARRAEQRLAEAEARAAEARRDADAGGRTWFAPPPGDDAGKGRE